MCRLHQDRRRGGGRCGVLCVPRFSTWQTWWHRRHQEATSTSQNCIHQTPKHLEVRKIQPEDQAAHPREYAGSTPVSALIQVRRWRWIGHILRTSPRNISRTALTWAPEGKRRRGRPREMWRTTMEKERNKLGWHSCEAAAASVADRDGWCNLLASLKSPHGPNEDK